MTAKAAHYRLVICCGMIRSGSTLQYQIALALLERVCQVRALGFIEPGDRLALDQVGSHEVAICKLHHFDPEFAQLLRQGQARALYSFRDIPGIAASAMRQFKKTFREIWDDRWLQSSAKYGDLWLAEPNVYSAKYELLTQDLVEETRHIARHLGIEPTEEEILRVAAEHSPSAQRRRLRTLKTDKDKGYCEKTLFHPGHLSDEPAAKALNRLK